MRFVTFTGGGSSRLGRLGALSGEAVVDFRLAADALGREWSYATLLELLDAGRKGLDEAADLLDRATRRGDESWLVSRSQVTLLHPLVPGKILAMGRNYREHAAEGGHELYGAPTGFIKCSSTLVGDGAPVAYPRWCKQFDYEVELAVVIGKEGKYIAPERAMEYVAGYTVFNDLSARDVQMDERKRGNHLLGKNFDGAGPIGPSLVTADEVADPHNLAITLKVNGELRQNSRTSDMIYDIPAQIAHWSQMTLFPGDILATGTPAGTANGVNGEHAGKWLQPGEDVECEVEGLGVLRTRIGPKD